MMRRSLLGKSTLIALALFCSLMLVSCFTLVESALETSVLGYPSSLVEENMRTLDPGSSYSRRAAILMMLLGDERKMSDLSKKYGGLVDLVLKSDRKEVIELSLLTDDDPVKMFLTYPEESANGPLSKYPVILFAHGGGFTGQDFSVYERFVKSLANSTGCAVAFYEYRLAPAHKFPAAVEDTWMAYKWLMDDSVSDCYRLDNGNFFLMGDSSGGNLMAGLALRIAENAERSARGVVLAYPSLDVSDRMNFSRIAFSGIEDPSRYYVTSLKYLSYVREAYLEKPQDAYEPYASPLIMLEGFMDVKGYDNPFRNCIPKLELPLDLPEHLVLVPEIDALRDEGKTYYALLKAFGAEASFKEYTGMFHGFLMANSFVGRSAEAFNDIVSFIGRKLSDPGKDG